MLTTVKPRTMATTLIRISRAMDIAEGERSIECLMFKVEKAMACLTATSERSIWAEEEVQVSLVIPCFMSAVI